MVRQELSILEAVNDKRRHRGYAPVPEGSVRRTLKVCKPFDWGDADYDPAEDAASGGRRVCSRMTRDSLYLARGRVQRKGGPSDLA